MRIILFIRNNNDQWIAISTATTEKQFKELMEYASHKVLLGNDIKIVHG